MQINQINLFSGTDLVCQECSGSKLLISLDSSSEYIHRLQSVRKSQKFSRTKFIVKICAILAAPSQHLIVRNHFRCSYLIQISYFRRSQIFVIAGLCKALGYQAHTLTTFSKQINRNSAGFLESFAFVRINLFKRKTADPERPAHSWKTRKSCESGDCCSLELLQKSYNLECAPSVGQNFKSSIQKETFTYDSIIKSVCHSKCVQLG